MGRTVACIIARTSSSRLKKKVLREIHGKTFIEHIIQKLKYVNAIDDIYMCTSVDEDDAILMEIANRAGIKGYAGSRESPIDRMLAVAEMENATDIVRVTGDNIFCDEIFLQKLVEEHGVSGVDYTRAEFLPLGVTGEVMSVPALKKCHDLMDPKHSQYLMMFMFDPDNFSCLVIVPEPSLQAEFASLTVDTPDDFRRTVEIYNNLYRNGRIYYDDIIAMHNRTPIPNFEIDASVTLKMPGNKTISYAKFREIMRERVERSIKIALEAGFYENKKIY